MVNPLFSSISETNRSIASSSSTTSITRSVFASASSFTATLSLGFPAREWQALFRNRPLDGRNSSHCRTRHISLFRLQQSLGRGPRTRDKRTGHQRWIHGSRLSARPRQGNQREAASAGSRSRALRLKSTLPLIDYAGRQSVPIFYVTLETFTLMQRRPTGLL